MKKILSSLALFVLITACKKTAVPVQTDQEFATASSTKKGGSSSPTVTTTLITYVLSFGATSGGSVSSSGGGNNVTEKGVCVSTSPNPTIADSRFPSGSGSGDFITGLSGLAGNTTYYARAYATKTSGTTYGNEVSFTTANPNYGTVTDYDGNVYTTIQIGSQVWTVENLKTTHYRDGTPIPNVTDNTAWYNLSTGAWCSYNNDDANVATYGRLYNWYAVNDARNLAPEGWHVPSYSEWYTTLMNSLGGLNGCAVAGKKLKDNVLWNGDNSSGFKALPAGRRYSGDCLNGPVAFFSSFNLYGDWWTSTPTSNPDLAWYKELGSNDQACTIIGSACNLNYSKKTGYSIRLVKD